MRLALLQTAFVLIFSAGVAAAWGLRHPLPPLGIEGQRVTLDAAQSWGDSVLWIDARDKEDFANGHIPGAMPLTVQDFNKQYRVVARAHKDGQKIVIYCASSGCPLADRMAERLREAAGWPDIYVLKGGWETWQASGRK